MLRTRSASWLGLLTLSVVIAGCGAIGPASTSGSPTAGPETPVSVPSATTTTTPSASATPVPTPSATTVAPAKPAKPAAPKAVIAQGATGEKVRELQHRLSQLDWYAGVMTGRYAANTAAGVRGFQDKRGYSATGTVDAKTWAKLVSMTRTPTRDEKHNVLRPGKAIIKSGSSGDQVRELQARLKQVGWFSSSVSGSYGTVTTASVRGFQAKRAIPVTGEVDQRTWSRLTAMTRTPSTDEKHNKTPKPSASGLDRRCLTGRAMCISKSSNTLVWVIDGKPQLRVDVRFGSYRTPTREGAFSVGWKSRHHVSTIYDSPMPYAMFFSGGQAVHYSSDFAARGYAGASHGCVNVRNLGGIQTLFSQVRVGDKVVVYR